MPTWRPKSKQRWLRFVLIGLVLLLLTCIQVVRHAVYGNGRLHDLAKALVRKYRQSKTAAMYPPERADEPMPIFAGGLATGWQDWSWATHSMSATEHVYGALTAIEMTPEAYKGVYLHHDPVSISGWGSLRLALYGSSKLIISLADEAGKFGPQVHLESYLKAVSDKQGWSVATIPLADLGATDSSYRFSGVTIQGAIRAKQTEVFLDEIALLPDQSLPPSPSHITVAVTIDMDADRHPISPYIYGMAFAPEDYFKDLNLSNNRWGGNDKSRYNWVQGNACNAARDWRWANRLAQIGPIPTGPSSAADRFIARNNSAGLVTVLTVPTIGWVARDADNANTSVNVPNQGGAPLTSTDGGIAGYDPSDNRRRTSIRSVARKGRPFTEDPTMTPGIVCQDEWIHHLVKVFGPASSGGVRFYAMDNEPDIWDVTHTDIHPARLGYDDMLANFLEYAEAVKSVDPTAQVTGPVLSGWTAYLYSSLDRGDDKFHTHADCTRHGGEAFILWFLKHVRARDAGVGKRSLDVLDVHFYPQGPGIYGGQVDKDTQDRRLRSTRALWDPDYVDESWIAEPVQLIPRLKQWISAGYPGTKIGITEWNYGADNTINGALTIADVLGIYGRDSVYLADYWAYPPKGSPGYLAFRIFRNADKHGHGFGDVSCRGSSANQDQVSCYSAIDSSTGDLTIVLVNKMRKATTTIPIKIGATNSIVGTPRMWLLTSEHSDSILETKGSAVHDGTTTVTLPPYSVMLVRIPPRQGLQR